MSACALLMKTPESNKRVQLFEPPSSRPWMSPGEVVDCALGLSMAASQNAFVQARNARDALRLAKGPLLSPGLTVFDGTGPNEALFAQKGVQQKGVQQQGVQQKGVQQQGVQQKGVQQQGVQQQQDASELVWPGHKWRLGAVKDRSGTPTDDNAAQGFWNRYFNQPTTLFLLKALNSKPVQVSMSLRT